MRITDREARCMAILLASFGKITYFGMRLFNFIEFKRGQELKGIIATLTEDELQMIRRNNPAQEGREKANIGQGPTPGISWSVEWQGGIPKDQCCGIICNGLCNRGDCRYREGGQRQ